MFDANRQAYIAVHGLTVKELIGVLEKKEPTLRVVIARSVDDQRYDRVPVTPESIREDTGHCLAFESVPGDG